MAPTGRPIASRDGDLDRFRVRRTDGTFGEFDGAAARRAQRAQRAGGDRGRRGLRPRHRSLREGLAAFRGVKRRLEVVGTAATASRLRRLRASSDGGGRDARRRCARRTRHAHLGDLRAALGLVVPPRVPGRLRARVRRRRRSRDRVGVSLEPAAGGAAVGRRSWSRISRAAAPRAISRTSTRSSAPSPARPRRRPRRGDVERRLWRHSPASCSEALA